MHSKYKNLSPVLEPSSKSRGLKMAVIKFEIDITNLIGHEKAGSVETIQDGGVFYRPLSGEFLQLAKSTPQVSL